MVTSDSRGVKANQFSTQNFIIKEVNVSDEVFRLGQNIFLEIYNTLVNSGSGKT